MNKLATIGLYTLLVVSIAFFVVTYIKANTSSNSTPPVVVQKQTSVDEEILFNLVNEWRVNNNLKPLLVSEPLCDFASIRVEEIKKDFSHDKAFVHRKNTGINVGENLSAPFTNPNEQKLLNAWLNSPTHKDNIADDHYIYSCLKCSENYCVQIFSYSKTGY